MTNNINYSKLNDRIVTQAYTASGIEPADLNEIYQAKVERARAMIEARSTVRAHPAYSIRKD